MSDITEGKRARREEIITLACDRYTREGEIEIDEGDDEKDISEGDDNGCYVRAWVWVDFSGTKHCKVKEDSPDSDMCPADCPHHGEAAS